MSDRVSIALIAVLCSGTAGLLGSGVLYRLRRRSLRLATLGVAVIAVGVLAAGLVGTSRAMFISPHDLGVITEVVLVAGVVALLFAVTVGEHLVRSSRALQRRAREFGETGRFTAVTTSAPAELAALAEELERASDRLEEAAERERRLEGSRRELVAWVSHDLRTPLAGLRAMAEALEDGLVDDPDRYHARIASEVERMSRMVDDLFALSRLQAGVFEVHPVRVPLSDLVSEAVAGADPIARAGGVRLTGAVDEEVLVDADPAGLRRVLLNLLTNAIRHTGRDGEVAIRGRRDGTAVELDVDDGCGGIPADDLPRVFDLAWRGSSARSPDDSAGAGLGLAIVKGIVEAHHGTVSVANHDPGCRFVVRLPQAATAAG